MKTKEFWITALAVAAFATVSVLAYRHAAHPSADTCQICQRPLHHGVSYVVEMKDGTRETACCPRCGMHLQVARPDAVAQAWATDVETGQTVPAAQATYVEGGDIEYCTMHSNPVQREPEGVAVRAFDRCLPSLVAFRTRTEADSYRAQHGGRTLDYAQALESVRER